MTKFSSLFGALLGQKMRRIATYLEIYLLTVLVFSAYSIIRYGVSLGDLAAQAAGFSMVFSFVVFFIFARSHESVWCSSTYRLIPTSNTKLYFATHLSTLISYFVFSVVTFVVPLLIDLRDAISFFQNDIHITHNSAMLPVTFLWLIALIFVVILYGWVFITTIHLLTNFISDFLPRAYQRISRLVLIVGILILLGFAFDKLENLLMPLFAFHSINLDNSVFMYSIPLWLLMEVLICSGINIYLLKHWTDITPKAN
jgi:hypothetical protein